VFKDKTDRWMDRCCKLAFKLEAGCLDALQRIQTRVEWLLARGPHH